MRRRFKAVMDVPDAMIRHGASLSRSVELTAQWDEILTVGPLYPVTLDDFHAVEGSCLGDFHRTVCDVHRRLSDFIHWIVVHRRYEAIKRWRHWLREDPWYTRISGFVQIWFAVLHFSSVSLILHLVVLEYLLIRLGLMRNSERPGFPIFAVLGKGIPASRNSIGRLMGGYYFYWRSSSPVGWSGACRCCTA